MMKNIDRCVIGLSFVVGETNLNSQVKEKMNWTERSVSMRKAPLVFIVQPNSVTGSARQMNEPVMQLVPRK